MVTLSDLVATLEALLASELGTVQEDEDLPAITTVPSPFPPESIQGLLCTVQQYQEGETIPVTGGKFKNKTFVVRLTQYDRTKSVAKAASIIENHPDFVIVDSPRYIPPTSKYYEQVTFHIRNSHLILN